MKITTTKKLRGVLELTSLGIQMAYDHKKDKPQIRTLEDRFYANSDLQAASDLKLIKISDVNNKSTDDIDDDDDLDMGPEPTVKLVNKTANPILIAAAKVADSKEIPANGFLVLPVSILDNPAVAAVISSGKIEVVDLETKGDDDIEPEDGDPTPCGPLDLDDDDEGAEGAEAEEVPEDNTTAVVANPNNDKVQQTDQSIKSVSATKPKPVKDETHSKMQVYSPQELKNEEEKKTDNDIAFVDQEQEQERIDQLTTGDPVDTETAQTEKLEDTTPTVVKRKTTKKAAAKTAAKKTSKKVTTKKTTAKKAAKKSAPGEKTVLDI